MIKLGLTVCMIIFVPVAVNAENFATVTQVIPNYFYKKSYVKEKSCYTEEEPIYEKSSVGGANGGGVLTGIVLGGLLGKSATGKDKGALAGAVLGGIIAANRNNINSTIIGHKPIVKCETIRIPQTTKTIKNYKINYEWNGIIGSSYTYNNYHVGQHIPVSVNISAK